MHDVEAIAVRPHAMGMADHDRVRDYIMGRLVALGLKPQLQTTTAVGTRYQEAGRVQNILAWMPGASTAGKAVLLVVHYDGVEAGPAAADDGAGCAALLETLRALRARKEPLAHDVIALFTDGEEAGLLGAAAFVREHPWAKDVAFIMNFEARGTTGRSYMFETGQGNRDAVSQLRSAGDVTAGSVFTTIYRALPNDTDLSELSLLGVPALNFAFADGVLRYHSGNDDVAHLDPRSVQHHGAQMLAVTRKVANEELPRPKTNDAVFFDLPLLGLVVYPIGFALPLAAIALVLTVVVVRRQLKGVGVGALAMIAALAISAAIGWMVKLHGPAMWSGTFAAALALAVMAINLLAYEWATRWSPDAHAGALTVWLLVAIATSFAAPGASYLFTWPLLFALVAARSGREIAWWLAVAVTLLLLAGLAYTIAAIMLGVAGPGSAVLAVVTALIVWLCAPLVVQRGRWAAAILAAARGVRGSGGRVRDHRCHDVGRERRHADAERVGFRAKCRRRRRAARVARGDERLDDRRARTDGDVAACMGLGASIGALFCEAQPRATLEAPTATLVRDTLIDGARRVIVRVNAPRGTTALTLRASGAPVLRTAIDARVVDTTRFRRRPPTWSWSFWAVPDSGAVFSIAVPPSAHFDLAMIARRPGLPPSVVVPPRPANVVPQQTGDVSVVYRTVRF